MRVFSKSLVLTAIIVSGCSNDTAPPPAAGFRNESVSYEPAPLTNAEVIQAPTLTLNEWPSEPISIPLPKEIFAKGEIAIEGVIEVDDPEMRDAMVYAEFFKRLPGGKRVTTNSGNGTVSNDESSDQRIRYRVEMHAPMSTGKQFVELRLMHLGTSKEFRTFAEGETSIKAAPAAKRGN